MRYLKMLLIPVHFDYSNPNICIPALIIYHRRSISILVLAKYNMNHGIGGSNAANVYPCCNIAQAYLQDRL